jgi:hypothetical protein
MVPIASVPQSGAIENQAESPNPVEVATHDLLRQIESNRRNALKNTGPGTVEGKERSHCNAFRSLRWKTQKITKTSKATDTRTARLQNRPSLKMTPSKRGQLHLLGPVSVTRQSRYLGSRSLSLCGGSHLPDT